MSLPRRLALAGLGLAFLLLPEAVYFAGAKLAVAPPGGGSCAVLVLGFPTRKDGSPHPIQRFRTEVGVAAFRRHGCGRLVISGGSPHSAFIEAETMGRLALEAGIPAGSLDLEKRAGSTEENIVFSLPRLESFERIVLASDGLHVHRGRRYLCRRRPELCARTGCAAGYSPFSGYFYKWAGMTIESYSRLRDALLSLGGVGRQGQIERRGPPPGRQPRPARGGSEH